jgi:hypothetical protein
MKFLKFTEYSILQEGINSIIFKFTEEEDTSVSDMDEYIYFLKNKYSAKTIGGGSSAEILETPSKEIIKVFSANDDPGMIRFLSFISENPKNLLVPKISRMMRIRAIDENRWICSLWIEDLKPLPNKIKSEIDTLLNDPKWEGLNIWGGNNEERRNKFMDEFGDLISKYTSASKKDFLSLFSFLKGHLKKYPEMLDFGSKNWMLRGNNIVLIDPFWPGHLKD